MPGQRPQGVLAPPPGALRGQAFQIFGFFPQAPQGGLLQMRGATQAMAQTGRARKLTLNVPFN